ncbi:hypothetical protein IAD21_02139 [Abditibacteriota bacterium]|nr:hypothetical protein IAD21_02139 [Abditibacteriota bacterium]
MSDFSEWPAHAAHLVPCFAQNASNIDVEGAFPDEEIASLRQAGLLGASVPCGFGGGGLGTDVGSTEALLQTLWHIGRGNLSVGRLFEGHVNALQLVYWFGTEEQKSRLFADALNGHLFGVWNTQANGGVRFEPKTQTEGDTTGHIKCPASGPEAQVSYRTHNPIQPNIPDQKGECVIQANSQNHGWVMQGSKTFCSGATRVSRPIVTGERDGWQMAVVPMDRAEVKTDPSWWQPLGMRASASFATDFSGAVLRQEDLLGGAGDYYQQPAFSGGAIRFCAVQLGGAAALFEETREFLNATGRNEDPFARARVGQMAAKVQSGWQWLRSAGEAWERRGDGGQMVAFAAMMRVATEEICNSVLEMAERSVGARGLLRPCAVERLSRDLTMYLKQPHLDEIPVRVGKFAMESEAPAHELWSGCRMGSNMDVSMDAKGCGG